MFNRDRQGIVGAAIPRDFVTACFISAHRHSSRSSDKFFVLRFTIRMLSQHSSLFPKLFGVSEEVSVE